MLSEVISLVGELKFQVLLISIIAIWLLKLDLAKTFDIFNSKKSSDLKFLIESLSNHHLDEKFKDSIKERVEFNLFYKAYGILAEKPYRDCLIKLNRKYPLEANWLVLKRSYAFVKIDNNGDLSVKIRKRDIYYQKANKLFASIIIIYGLLLVVLSGLEILLSEQYTIENLIMGFLFFPIGMYISWTGWGRSAAIKLAKVVNN